MGRLVGLKILKNVRIFFIFKPVNFLEYYEIIIFEIVEN